MDAVKLEEKILSSGLLNAEQAQRAKDEERKTGLAFSRIVVKLGFATEEDIAGLTAEIMGVPFIDVDNYLIDAGVAKLLPEQVAKKYDLIPLFKIKDTLTVAMVDPHDIIAIDEVRLRTRCRSVEPVLSTKGAIDRAISKQYGGKGAFEEVVSQIDKAALERPPQRESANARTDPSQDAPVVKLVNVILHQAISEEASDIHVEPEENALRIRYRIDGVLRESTSPPSQLAEEIVSRIKVLAHMDISEKRKPQDGKIQLRLPDRDVDLRVSTFPTIHGENIVLRILDKSSILLDMDELGFEKEDLDRFQKLIRKSYGMILVTGPTGSGKTTTLYSALAKINSSDKNIITIEDPVEYQLPLIRQTQINPRAGITFANGLRSILRQDPDIIMVGEVRDKETAEVGIQAALTGHLVMSTLHTNDACGALARLIDMGIEPFLISTSVIGVISQRLVRMICKQCKESYPVPAPVLSALGIQGQGAGVLYRGKGCDACKQTGYRGRTAVYELLTINEAIRTLIAEKVSSTTIKQEAIKSGLVPLRENGLRKALRGVTTMEEILRVSQEE
ncbi:MAG: ATPase, T2SS/T4P/T4SS family [Candidatus Omnitrophota bacterium]